MFETFDKQLTSAQIPFYRDVCMKDKTWIHRGPVVSFYVMPRNADELELAVLLLEQSGLRYKIVGHTSNIYMLPSYSVDAIVSTAKMTSYTMEDGTLTCDAGVNISHLASDITEQGYDGFEGLVGLPGTIAAAIVNNASCYNCVASRHLVSATILRYDNGTVTKMTVDPEFFEFEHRNTAIKSGKVQAVILNLTFGLNRSKDIDALRRQSKWNRWHRNTWQEGKAKNLGSVYSMRCPKRYGFEGIWLWRLPMWPILKIADRLFIQNYWYQSRRSHLVLWLYGYEDLIPYVSSKNDNCFIWRDAQADEKFIRYQEFMHKSCELGRLEIEILK